MTTMTKNAKNAPKRRQSAQADIRTALMQAAWELYLTQGYTDTTLAHIAERAGCTRTPIYNLFGSKEGLYVHTCDWQRRRQWGPHISELVPLGAALDQLMGALAERLHDHLQDQDYQRWVALEQSLRVAAEFDPAAKARLNEQLHSVRAELERVLTRHAAAAGEQLPDPELAVLLLESAYRSMAQARGADAQPLPTSLIHSALAHALSMAQAAGAQGASSS